MAFFGFFDNKEDPAVAAALQALTTAVNGLQSTVTGLRNNTNVLIGRIDKLMAIDTDLQNEVAAENVDIQKLLTAQNQEIADFQQLLASKPSETIPADVQASLTTLLSNIQATHQTVIDATKTVQAADPVQPPTPAVTP